jgi:hypothetical protein
MFNFDTHCLLCAGSVKGCKRRDISIVSHQSTVTLITNLCRGTCDSAAVAVTDRMLGCDLVELNARYHKLIEKHSKGKNLVNSKTRGKERRK